MRLITNSFLATLLCFVYTQTTKAESFDNLLDVSCSKQHFEHKNEFKEIKESLFYFTDSSKPIEIIVDQLEKEPEPIYISTHTQTNTNSEPVSYSGLQNAIVFQGVTFYPSWDTVDSSAYAPESPALYSLWNRINNGEIVKTLNSLSVYDGLTSMLVTHSPGAFGYLGSNLYDGGIITVYDEEGNTRDYSMNLFGVYGDENPDGSRKTDNAIANVIYNGAGEALVVMFCRGNINHAYLGYPIN